jgi:5S rRNA maturation endonuclease (ribonuclease M5)
MIKSHSNNLFSGLLHYLEKAKLKPVIVEGKKDKKCLESLGFMHVIEINKRPLYKVVEDTAAIHKEVIILTDLDKTGKKLFSYLNSGLQMLGVRVDNSLRNYLFKFTKLRQIEGLRTYIEHSIEKN